MYNDSVKTGQCNRVNYKQHRGLKNSSSYSWKRSGPSWQITGHRLKPWLPLTLEVSDMIGQMLRYICEKINKSEMT